MADNRTQKEKERDYKESLENDRVLTRTMTRKESPSKTARKSKR